MRIASLLYHDVVAGEGFAASGFAGGDADIYKLRREAFAAHLDAVCAVARPAAPLDALLAASSAGVADGAARAVLFTFDDGGEGAHAHTAPLLEARGWRGYFFIATDWIGRTGFLDAGQIADLHRRGHVIGSHSCSHPTRMSSLPDARILAEWRDSVRRLEDVIGAPVRVGSVPAGFYSPRVAELAFESGLSALFNSEPTAAVRQVASGAVLGRFSIMRDDTPTLPRAFAAGEPIPALRQALLWNAKKVVKAVGGEHWLAFRRRVLASR